ncbi:hypothetical protein S245_020711 [Arachis hypogaea]|nr:uncharacterized protein DS421_6g190910 [Arachis hypogaea]
MDCPVCASFGHIRPHSVYARQASRVLLIRHMSLHSYLGSWRPQWAAAEWKKGKDARGLGEYHSLVSFRFCLGFFREVEFSTISLNFLQHWMFPSLILSIPSSGSLFLLVKLDS